MPTSFDSFERAFRGGVSGLRRTCECGVEYWDSYNTGYDWEEGEREALETDPKAKALNHSVGIVEFEGHFYVDGCDCWHDRAKRIATWIDDHAVAIAEYLTLENKRKQAEADASPMVALNVTLKRITHPPSEKQKRDDTLTRMMKYMWW